MISEDVDLCRSLNEGKDVHQETANKIGSSRDEAKEVVFGVAYRMGAWGLANRLRQKGLYCSLGD